MSSENMPTVHRYVSLHSFVSLVCLCPSFPLPACFHFICLFDYPPIFPSPFSQHIALSVCLSFFFTLSLCLSPSLFHFLPLFLSFPPSHKVSPTKASCVSFVSSCIWSSLLSSSSFSFCASSLSCFSLANLARSIWYEKRSVNRSLTTRNVFFVLLTRSNHCFELFYPLVKEAYTEKKWGYLQTPKVMLHSD